MAQSNDWIPMTLIEMAAFCEKNGLEKAKNVLIEAAMMIHIDFANQSAQTEDLSAETYGPKGSAHLPLSDVIVRLRQKN